MDDRQDALQGLNRAISAAGGGSALARALKLSPSAVANWKAEGGIPASRVPSVARVTGLAPEELRPDLFRIPEQRRGLAEQQMPIYDTARALGIDAPAIAEDAIRAAIAAERARRWATDNRAALDAHARYVEEHGLPLNSHRMF
jgi:post-segregation antitoxin (ccd killing protein)/DNA-binding transcriptional regulator YdaS (Cro superfamily)